MSNTSVPEKIKQVRVLFGCISVLTQIPYVMGEKNAEVIKKIEFVVSNASVRSLNK